MLRFRPVVAFLLLTCAGLFPVAAQDDSAALSAAEELVRQEQVRSAVRDALQLQANRADSGGQQVENLVRAVEDMEQLGPDAIPYLINELEQDLKYSYFFCAYALGQFDSTEAEQALRDAIVRAEAQEGDYPAGRKAWAAWALALMGKLDALDLLSDGRHLSGHFPFHAHTSVLESAGLILSPESVPHLLEQLDDWDVEDNPDLRMERIYSLKALQRIADPAATPRVVRALEDDPDPMMRRQAARALGTIGGDDAIAALERAMNDLEPRVQRSAVHALRDLHSPRGHDMFVKRLETETDLVIRGLIYELLLQQRGAEAIPLLESHWAKAGTDEYFYLTDALARRPHAEAMPMLKAALAAGESRSVARSVEALGKLGTDEAEQVLLDVLRSNNWSLVQLATERHASAGQQKAAPILVERLVKVEAVGAKERASFRDRVRVIGEALIALGNTDALEGLRAIGAELGDVGTKAIFDGLISRFEMLEANGENTARWIEALDSETADQRMLAYRRLGELGGKKAARALTEQFGRVDLKEGAEILRALRNVDNEVSRKLIVRVLTSDLFRDFSHLELRENAAWAARTIGGPKMVDALRTAVEMRDARDARVLVYLILASHDEGLATYSKFRIERMRYIKWSRGEEQLRLDSIARSVRAGRSIARYDQPPERINMR
ncbi:MAG: HEAT repeat domain-containing protein [bacterium]|nr:HEAT repeat domain-containing protein [bacterium]